ncbi:MAG: SRPBCC family protein [Bacteroidetes bacterium]|nr:SRPBCC family protein [Bacteroidota bacterium]
MSQKIVIQTRINAPKSLVWETYTQPQHVMGWNFADPSWHCPHAENDLRVGGQYVARMEARDGSYGFDFEAIYTEVNLGERFTYEFGGRFATVDFKEAEGQTEVTVTFDPENENPVELQRQGWQSILNNFKAYCESKTN